MSDPAKIEPEEELLEFLGGIDEANEADQDDDFAEFLAHTDIDRLTQTAKKKSQEPKKVEHE